jgi:hypothetical protein
MFDLKDFTEEAKGIKILVLGTEDVVEHFRGADSNKFVVDSKDFLLTYSVIEVIERFKKLGFFQTKENNLVIFQRIDFRYDGRSVFQLSFGADDDYMGGGINVFVQPTVRTDATIINGMLGPVEETSLDDLEEKLLNRFNTYDFTPNNGWGFMYYLDFITGMTVEWSNEEIQLLDEYKTKGLLMAAAKTLINKGISVSAMEPAIGMPIAWVEKAYGVTK